MIRYFAVLLLFLGACSAEPEQQPIKIEGKGAPALWKVDSDKGGTAYLFGTVHLLPPDTQWQGPAIDEAIRGSDSLTLEVTGLEDQQAVAELFGSMGVQKGLPPLSDRLPADLRAPAAKLAKDADIPANILDGMKSWAAALTLASSVSSNMGLVQDSGVEHVLQLQFQAQQKPIYGLETISQQFGFFDALPEKDQRILLDDVIREAAKDQDDYRKMLEDWMAGRADKLLDSANEGMLASPIIRKSLLDGRNQNWATQIAQRLDKGGKLFVAVGAGHLAGPNGVPALLQAKGYRVTRVQ